MSNLRIALRLTAVAATLLTAQAAWADRADRALLLQAFQKAGQSEQSAEPKVELLDEIIEKIAARHIDARSTHPLAEKAAAVIEKA